MKQITVVRKDLQMSVGKTAAQVAHAVVGVLMHTPSPRKVKWIEEGMPKVVLAVEDEAEFDTLLKVAERAGLNFFVVHDAGRTEVASGTATCVGFAPMLEKFIDEVTGKLKLL